MMIFNKRKRLFLDAVLVAGRKGEIDRSIWEMPKWAHPHVFRSGDIVIRRGYLGVERVLITYHSEPVFEAAGNGDWINYYRFNDGQWAATVMDLAKAIREQDRQEKRKRFERLDE